MQYCAVVRVIKFGSWRHRGREMISDTKVQRSRSLSSQVSGGVTALCRYSPDGATTACLVSIGNAVDYQQERVRCRAERPLEQHEDGQTVGARRHFQVVSQARHYWSVWVVVLLL